MNDSLPTQGQEGISGPVVIARCITCGSKREIRAGEIAPGDHPMCETRGCGGLMIAESARS